MRFQKEIIGPELAFFATGEDGDDAAITGGRQSEEWEEGGGEEHAGVVSDGSQVVESFGSGSTACEGQVTGGEDKKVDVWRCGSVETSELV